MANTYELISNNVLGSSTASVSFSSIPTTFTDLVLRISARNATNGAVSGNALITINSNATSSNYSTGRFSLAGPSTVSASVDSTGSGIIGCTITPIGTGSTAPANSFGFCEIYISNYRSSDFLYLSASSFSATDSTMVSPTMTAGGWHGGTPITSITIASSGGNFATNSSFSLYGIKNT